MAIRQELTMERLLSRTERRGECLIWTGSGRGLAGHGQIRSGGEAMATHRAAWLLAKGPIPEGMHVLHRCDTPRCVNVEHLFLGTHKENMADRHVKGRDAIHRGEDNGQAKLTAELVATLRARYKPKHRKDGAAAMAREVGVHPTTLRDALFGVSWKG